jgi:hypothetical protein
MKTARRAVSLAAVCLTLFLTTVGLGASSAQSGSSSVVLLSDQQMGDVYGGQDWQNVGVGIGCLVGAETATHQFPLYITPVLLSCAAEIQVEMLWGGVVDPLTASIRTVLTPAVTPFRQIDFLDSHIGNLQCTVGWNTDGSCAAFDFGFTDYIDVVGELSAEFCHYSGCRCDDDNDCDSWICFDGHCQDDGMQ